MRRFNCDLAVRESAMPAKNRLTREMLTSTNRIPGREQANDRGRVALEPEELPSRSRSKDGNLYRESH